MILLAEHEPPQMPTPQPVEPVNVHPYWQTVHSCGLIEDSKRGTIKDYLAPHNLISRSLHIE